MARCNALTPRVKISHLIMRHNKKIILTKLIAYYSTVW